MSTQYRLVQSGKTASGGCSAGQGSSEPVAPRIFYFIRRYTISELLLFLNFIPALIFFKNTYRYGMFLNNAFVKRGIEKVACLAPCFKLRSIVVVIHSGILYCC
jgi:hypothetical protein